jgi:hypothetical protein
MKSSEWQRFLERQRDDYGKILFTVGELANVADVTPAAVNVELSRLRQRGAIERYAQGIYGLKQELPPEDLLPYLDARAYITGIYALSRRNVITQVPVVVSCFTNRRHNRSRVRSTPLGRFEFSCVKDPIHAMPADGVVAPPEQALFDFVYIARRHGADARSAVTFRNLNELRETMLLDLAPRYPRTVRRQVSDILMSQQ